MERRKYFPLGEQNLLVDSSVTSAKYDSIGCGNITVLFYWQLDSKLAGMYEYKPQLWDCGVLMPSVNSLLLMPQHVYLWKKKKKRLNRIFFD